MGWTRLQEKPPNQLLNFNQTMLKATKITLKFNEPGLLASPKKHITVKVWLLTSRYYPHTLPTPCSPGETRHEVVPYGWLNEGLFFPLLQIPISFLSPSHLATIYLFWNFDSSEHTGRKASQKSCSSSNNRDVVWIEHPLLSLQ